MYFFVAEAQFELGGSLGGNLVPNQVKAELGEIRRSTNALCSDSVCCPQGFSPGILICFSL